MIRYRICIDGTACKKFHKLSFYKDFVAVLSSTLGIAEIQFQASDLGEVAGRTDVVVCASFRESGLMVHSWKGGEEVSLYMISSTHFDRDQLVNVFEKAFGPDKVEVKYDLTLC